MPNTNPKFMLEDVVFLGRVEHRNLPIILSDTLDSLTTPDVTNRTLMKASGNVVSVSNFLGGRDSQLLRIVGDGTTTIVNGTYIKVNTGANKLLSLNKVYTFSYIESEKIWYENV